MTMLRDADWLVNVKRVERTLRQEGSNVPASQPKRGRLWLNNGSCIQLRPERPNHVWVYDFMEDRTHKGRKFRMLNVIAEFTRECLYIRIDHKLKSADVIDILSDLLTQRNMPGHIRSDNGPEFIATAAREWITAAGAKIAFIELGSPWKSGSCKSFNSKLRDEPSNGDIFYSLAETRIVIEGWRQHRNTNRPLSSLGYSPPAPATVPCAAAPAQPASPANSTVADKPTTHWICTEPGNMPSQ